MKTEKMKTEKILMNLIIGATVLLILLLAAGLIRISLLCPCPGG